MTDMKKVRALAREKRDPPFPFPKGGVPRFARFPLLTKED